MLLHAFSSDGTRSRYVRYLGWVGLFPALRLTSLEERYVITQEGTSESLLDT